MDDEDQPGQQLPGEHRRPPFLDGDSRGRFALALEDGHPGDVSRWAREVIWEKRSCYIQTRESFGPTTLTLNDHLSRVLYFALDLMLRSAPLSRCQCPSVTGEVRPVRSNSILHSIRL